MNAARRVLIVGGGIAGMSCAIELRKTNIGVDLIDIDSTWRSYGAGITLTGPTLRALRTVGVLEEVVSHGATWGSARVHDRFGNLLETFEVPPLESGLPSTGGIMRPVLHQILSRRTLATGARVRLGVTLSDLRETDTEVEATFSDGTVSVYDLIVAADGISSKLRELVFPDAPKPTTTGQIVYRLLAERPPGFDCTHFYMGTDCKVGFNPVSRTHMYMFLLQPAAADPWISTERQAQALFDAMEGFGGLVPQIRNTVLNVNSASVNYRQLSVLLAPEPWHRGRVVLVGDAAHATTPHLASGAGMAIEDAIVLTEELKTHATLARTFANFMQRRFERCRTVIENSVELGRLEMNHGPPSVHTALMTQALAALRQPI